jgi:hypothetical protein
LQPEIGAYRLCANAALFLRLIPALGEQRALLSAKVVKAIAKSLVGLASASTDMEYRRQLIAEFKRVLQGYAESILRQKET